MNLFYKNCTFCLKSVRKRQVSVILHFILCCSGLSESDWGGETCYTLLKSNALLCIFNISSAMILFETDCALHFKMLIITQWKFAISKITAISRFLFIKIWHDTFLSCRVKWRWASLKDRDKWRAPRRDGVQTLKHSPPPSPKKRTLPPA